MKRDVPEEVNGLLQKATDEGSLGVEPVRLEQVRDYTTFNAEYTWKKDGKCLLHFFRSPERMHDTTYWEQTFPGALVDVAKKYFQAAEPRLTFEWVPEVDSICVCARDYDTVLDKDGYVRRFLEKLDERLDFALDAALAKPTST